MYRLYLRSRKSGILAAWYGLPFARVNTPLPDPIIVSRCISCLDSSCTFIVRSRSTCASGAHGTVNIRRRCELIGFRAELSTAPGEGTSWTITRA